MLHIKVREEKIMLHVDGVTVAVGDTYNGPYSITPTSSNQSIITANKIMTENLIVEAIPTNYGLITWNGSVLTVS